MKTMEKKFILYSFNGEGMCFAHVLLNAMEMHGKGYDVLIVVEGSSVKMIKEFHEDEKHPFNDLYSKVKSANLIHGVCLACATKMKVVEAVKAEKLPLIGSMSGHPPMSEFIDKGYQIITF
ncbi:hypothetical protein NEF87_000682 [Candidatus Lokiarchaeum ossiferum]|uniref:Cytoplasmic protein n=1 Tax=Candidatus Lokiarchaeum ossiferum TaxID=2951803 RepID=A0ABY6HNE5_9ARCH|nr:hypothetical protein NEF87_000682 [Candidatus Lokiarchaeum sp. B-35]